MLRKSTKQEASFWQGCGDILVIAKVEVISSDLCRKVVILQYMSYYFWGAIVGWVMSKYLAHPDFSSSR